MHFALPRLANGCRNKRAGVETRVTLALKFLANQRELPADLGLVQRGHAHRAVADRARKTDKGAVRVDSTVSACIRERKEVMSSLDGSKLVIARPVGCDRRRSRLVVRRLLLPKRRTANNTDQAKREHAPYDCRDSSASCLPNAGANLHRAPRIRRDTRGGQTPAA